MSTASLSETQDSKNLCNFGTVLRMELLMLLVPPQPTVSNIRLTSQKTSPLSYLATFQAHGVWLPSARARRVTVVSMSVAIIAMASTIDEA